MRPSLFVSQELVCFFGPKAQLQQLKNNGIAQLMTPAALATPDTAQGANSSSSPRGTIQIWQLLPGEVLVQTHGGFRIIPSHLPATRTFAGKTIPTPKSGDNSSKPLNRPSTILIYERPDTGAINEPKAPSKASDNAANKVLDIPAINSSSSGDQVVNPSTAAATVNRLLKPLHERLSNTFFRPHCCLICSLSLCLPSVIDR